MGSGGVLCSGAGWRGAGRKREECGEDENQIDPKPVSYVHRLILPRGRLCSRRPRHKNPRQLPIR
jgi:hypothetical protein